MALALAVLQSNAQPHKAQQAESGQKPALPVANAPIEKKDSSALKDETNKHVDADVWVKESPKKDAYDKAAVWINAILAVFAFAGILVGVFTLCYLRKQADEMRRQRKVMLRSLRAMREQGERENKAIVLQYRPRIIVRHARALTFSEEIDQKTITISETVRCVVAFQIVNGGGSSAHIVEGDVHLLSVRMGSDKEDAEITESTHIGISPRTLQPGEREPIQFGLDTRISNYAFYKSGDTFSVFLIGTIWYRDDLGIPRQTGLHRSYDMKTKLFTPRKDSEEEYSD
jgi:hypothetical protein